MVFNNSSKIWMIGIFVMCDYRKQKFYFLNFERHTVLSNVILNVQDWKNKAFEKECSNIEWANMALLKQQLAGKLAKKTLFLDEKVDFLDFAKRNPTLGCRKLAEIFKIGKIAAANIKEEKNIRSQQALFHEKSKNWNRCGKCWKINEILHEWYQRCCASNIYPNGPMLKEEAKTIKERLQDSNLQGFSVSDEWLDGWKTAYAIKECWKNDHFLDGKTTGINR